MLQLLKTYSSSENCTGRTPCESFKFVVCTECKPQKIVFTFFNYSMVVLVGPPGSLRALKFSRSELGEVTVRRCVSTRNATEPFLLGKGSMQTVEFSD